MPDSNVAELVAKYEEELRGYGASLPDENGDCMAIRASLCNDFGYSIVCDSCSIELCLWHVARSIASKHFMTR